MTPYDLHATDKLTEILIRELQRLQAFVKDAQLSEHKAAFQLRQNLETLKGEAQEMQQALDKEFDFFGMNKKGEA